MNDEIKWQEPPTDGRGRGRNEQIATALRKRPGAWALVREGSANTSPLTAMRGPRTASAFLPDGAFEARSHKRADGKLDIYARYVGEGGER